MIVWWTIPGSSVAWEWRPTESILVEGDLVRAGDGSCYLRPATIGPHRWPGPRQAAGQEMAEMTAYFAMEANVRPTGMAVAWFGDVTAVSWDRRTDRWRRHPVGVRDHQQCLHQGTDIAGAPVPRNVEEATTTALGLLAVG